MAEAALSSDNNNGGGTFNFTERYIVDLVSQMYLEPKSAHESSQCLRNFQISSSAWDISITLLLRCAPCLPDPEAFDKIKEICIMLETFFHDPGYRLSNDTKEIASFFAAQTLCTLCQTGLFEGVPFQQQISHISKDRFYSIRLGLTELLGCYRTIPYSPTVRQLTQSISATILFTLSHYFDSGFNVSISQPVDTNHLVDVSSSVKPYPYFDQSNSSQLQHTVHKNNILNSGVLMAQELISELIERFTKKEELYSLLLDIFSTLPIEIENKKFAITTEKRSIMSYLLLCQTKTIFQTIGTIHDMISGGICLSDYCPSTYQTFIYNGTYQRHSDVFRLNLKLIFYCYRSWLESLSRYHRIIEVFYETQTTPIQSTYIIPPLPNEGYILLESSLIPITLFHLEMDIRDSLISLNSNSFHLNNYFSEEYDPNTLLEDELDLEDRTYQTSSISSVITLQAGCDVINEIFEFLYSLYSYAPGLSQHQDISYNILSLINWTNLDSLMCMFKVLARIDTLIRLITNVIHSHPDITLLSDHSPMILNILHSASCTTDTPIYNDTPVVSLSQHIEPNLFSAPILRVFTVIMGKFSEIFFPALLFVIQYDTLHKTEFLNTGVTLPTLQDKTYFLYKSKSLCSLMIYLLNHVSLQFRQLVLEFWFSLIGNQFIQQQAQLETAAKESNNELEHQLNLQLNHQATTTFILETFHLLMDTLMKRVMYPKDIAHSQLTFPFSAWIKYRDECSMTITDMTSILTCSPIIEKAGSQLLHHLQTIKENPLSICWREIEVCLFILTAVAPRAQAGIDPYIPLAIESLPLLPYPKTNTVDSFIMSVAAARFMLWTAGYIGSKRELFAKCFQLIYSFIPSLMTINHKTLLLHHSEHTTVADDNELKVFKDYSERVMIEAMNSIVTAASVTLARDILVPESDVTFVLNSLAELVMITTLTMESRCSLVISAGALLQCLSIDKMQKYHYHLCQALYSRVHMDLPKDKHVQTYMTLDTAEFFKLFFTAVESVKPVDIIPVPPFSPNAVPLERSSEYRHPVLNIVEEFWPLFEKCFLEFHSSEMLIESACHCLIRTFSQSALHIIRYSIFNKFLELLATSFTLTPSIFHLAALRSMLGIFGSNREEPVLRQLNYCLLRCTEFVLKAMKTTGVRLFVSQSPDIVGMTLDCTNTVLSSAFLTAELLDLSAFYESLILAITLTPECRHPKVLMTMLLLMTRFVAWFDPSHKTPPSSLNLNTPSGSFEQRWSLSCTKCSESALRLATELNLIDKIIHSIVQAITEIFQGNSQWIGIIGTLLVDLFRTPSQIMNTKQSLRLALQNCSRQIVPQEFVDDFCNSFELPEIISNHRLICGRLQQLADQSEANWQKAQFSSNPIGDDNIRHTLL